MKKIATNMFFSALFLLFGFNMTAQTEKKPEHLTKETFKQKVWDYEASPGELKYLGDKPCIIDFYANWCGWCRKIAPFFEEFCNTYDGQIYVYKINTEEQKELQALFQVKSLPTILYINMNGKSSAIKGAVPKEQFEEYINQFLLGK
ncbi:MAG: thioredoxin fold domain-containing protein [Bacteroidales bacterium]|nr:thioredoxin fold domain-containing protein [Bacteroidales bacterium]